ncbi:BrnT family toxin [Jiella avicenniae]|uniref:BrnT family toxin n=1 Tax=Jiella avicenniae TaxID=2907202 RepID=A0A9X1T3Q6_9HYPH|nr:BrnT family toxin [Jiella avicenniae]MCE7026515.1 BrnT family toxin [Jiella avicenniae]
MNETRIFEWDEKKAAANRSLGRPPFEDALRFNFVTAVITHDRRTDYGEERVQAIGFIGQRLHVLIYTERHQRIRIISFRKANEREVRRYDRETGSFNPDESDG